MTDRELVAKALSDALGSQLGVAITFAEALRVLDAAKEIHDRLVLTRQSIEVEAGEVVIDVLERG